jgi:hypothetical protein
MSVMRLSFGHVAVVREWYEGLRRVGFCERVQLGIAQAILPCNCHTGYIPYNGLSISNSHHRY